MLVASSGSMTPREDPRTASASGGPATAVDLARVIGIRPVEPSVGGGRVGGVGVMIG